MAIQFPVIDNWGKHFITISIVTGLIAKELLVVCNAIYNGWNKNKMEWQVIVRMHVKSLCQVDAILSLMQYALVHQSCYVTTGVYELPLVAHKLLVIKK